MDVASRLDPLITLWLYLVILLIENKNEELKWMFLLTVDIGMHLFFVVITVRINRINNIVQLEKKQIWKY